MSAFSSLHHHLPLPLDSNTCFSQCYQPAETLQNIDQSTILSALSNINETSHVHSATNNNNMDSSSTVTHNYNISTEQLKHNNKSIPIMGNKRKCRKVPSANSAQSKDMRRVLVESKKQKKVKEEKRAREMEEGGSLSGYIHVRARRGQATDSHSLAERVRREKISERMKLLQSIVPGCDKVTGKALVLDQIIDYVQSLQNQVEFLSMKIASVNPISYEFPMELEPFMVSPNDQQCSPGTVNDFLLLDDSVNPLLFHDQQDQFSNALPEGKRLGNNLFSFH